MPFAQFRDCPESIVFFISVSHPAPPPLPLLLRDPRLLRDLVPQPRDRPHLQGVILLRAELAQGEDAELVGVLLEQGKVICTACFRLVVAHLIAYFSRFFCLKSP